MEHKEKLKIEEKRNSTVSFKMLGFLTIAFLLGFAACGLARNMAAPGAMTFSTPELINFVLGVLLAGASIFLAIAAIMLGKFSEQAMIQRSDESIRLQNEVFQKTTDALQRIESSTGVTEKRIEDIISGRAGDLSQKIVKQVEQGTLKPEDLAETIRKSLFQAMRQEGIVRTVGVPEQQIEELARQAAKEKEEEIAQAEYRKLHLRVLGAFAGKPGFTALKMGDGTPSSEGEGLFDGLFSKDSSQIGVSSFSKLTTASYMEKFVSNALKELKKKFVKDVYIIIFERNDNQIKGYNSALAIANDELVSHIHLVECAPDKIEETIHKLKP